jgi:ribonuclease J
MARVTFYGGVDEIGGNKILVHDKGTKVLFDFGQAFNCDAEYFTFGVLPRL